jgi:hypothetical protein
VYLWPAGTWAQADTGNSAVLTAEQARAAFTTSGFSADPIINWGWTAPSVRTFVVHDAASDRVLTVLVFQTSADAGLVRGSMALHQRLTSGDPYVLAGYGPSVWSGNVAMVERPPCNGRSRSLSVRSARERFPSFARHMGSAFGSKPQYADHC